MIFHRIGPPVSKKDNRIRFIFLPQGTRKAAWLVVSLFVSGILPEHTICYSIVDKLSFFLFSAISLRPGDSYRKKTRNFLKSLHLSKIYRFCRGPPDCRCSYPPIDDQEELCLINTAAML